MVNDNIKNKKGFSGLLDLASKIGSAYDCAESKIQKEEQLYEQNLTATQKGILREIYDQHSAANNFQLMAFFGITHESGKYIYKRIEFESLEEALIAAYLNRKRESSKNLHDVGEKKTDSSLPTKTATSRKSSDSPPLLDPLMGQGFFSIFKIFKKQKWILGIIGVIFAIWVFDIVDQSNKKPSYSPPSSSKSNSYLQSTPSPAVQTPSTTQSAGLQYTKPSVGTNNVLSVPEIRWCIREGIRIEAMRDVIDTNAGIDEFNQIVNDYNSRCVSYRYRQGSQSRAERDVEAYRSQIVAEAIREARQLGRSYHLSYPSVSAGVSTSTALKYPNSQYTREAQQLLIDLGYDPGPVDGDYGQRTAGAVKAFQRDAGISQDGWIDEDLLGALRRAKAAL